MAAADPVAEFVADVTKQIDKLLPTKNLFDPGSLVIGAALVVIAAVLIRMMVAKESAQVVRLRQVESSTPPKPVTTAPAKPERQA
jgi:short subunit fatty acids transporter